MLLIPSFNIIKAFRIFLVSVIMLAAGAFSTLRAQSADATQIIQVGKGWARSSVNTVVFRQNSVTSHGGYQFLAYYDMDGRMVLAKRKLEENKWIIHKSRFSADVRDAHNSISLGVDGNGYLHVSWGMHGNKLRYARSKAPHGLELTSLMSMTGKKESAVTYPQFYRLGGGDLLFVYRDGSSGRGDVMLNRYDVDQQQWVVVQHPLIDGQGERNAYVNTLAVGPTGNLHLSWTWRETWDVSTNHDIMYAYSDDEGNTWYKSTGDVYELPLTAQNSEVVCSIPKGSELINQTSMTVNDRGEPVIASYWRPSGDEAPQFHIVWRDSVQWKVRQVGQRSLDFSLSGGGTKRIPISRPAVLAGAHNEVYLVYRDFEHGGGITVAVSQDDGYDDWKMHEIYTPEIGLWEPTYDPVIWQMEHELHLFGQKVGQGDGETLEDVEPQEVFILKWIPPFYRQVSKY